MWLGNIMLMKQLSNSLAHAHCKLPFEKPDDNEKTMEKFHLLRHAIKLEVIVPI